MKMKKILLPLLALLFLISCGKENMNDLLHEHETHDGEGVTLRGPAPKIDVCHYDADNGTWHIINISENAWPAHAGHGDVRLDDQDNDGYVPYNECGYGQQGDCDDTNGDVNPGATEICGNGIDDDCDGYVDGADSDCTSGCVEGELVVTLPDGSVLYVYPVDNEANIHWGEYGNDIDGLANIQLAMYANLDFNGASNTAAIVDHLGNWNDGDYVANLCATLSNETGCEWYLPAAGELNAIYEQLGPNGSNDIPDGYYWTSTEYDDYQAWIKSFVSGVNYDVDKDSGGLSCRCVRR